MKRRNPIRRQPELSPVKPGRANPQMPDDPPRLRIDADITPRRFPSLIPEWVEILPPQHVDRRKRGIRRGVEAFDQEPGEFGKIGLDRRPDVVGHGVVGRDGG
jgi:hypothetical protein